MLKSFSIERYDSPYSPLSAVFPDSSLLQMIDETEGSLPHQQVYGLRTKTVPKVTLSVIVLCDKMETEIKEVKNNEYFAGHRRL